MGEPNKIDDSVTNKAVDDIMASESDAVIEAEDEKKLSESFTNKKPRRFDKITNFLKQLWQDPRKRKITLISTGALLLILLTVPPSRYFMLNTVGVRASASLIVLDEKSNQPLKNVKVSIGRASGQTDTNGQVKLSQIKLGSAQLKVERRAFAPFSRRITIGWGSNPLGDFKLTPTGVQYSFKVNDFLSDKPVVKAEAISGEFSALSDEEGKILLSVEKTDEEEIQVTIAADTYRSEELTINTDSNSEQQLKLVPGRKHVFISKRSGKYDLYRIDVDGKNEEKLLAGTGSEKSDLVLAAHPADEFVAYISTRENKRNKDGYLLEQLYIIDIKTGDKTLASSSERIQIVDWLGDRLVYVKIAEGTSGGNPQRHRLISYDYKTGSSKELAAANYFNDVLSAGGVIYWAPSAAYQAAATLGLYKINPDGTSKQTILTGEIWNIFRTAYDTLSISTGSDEWYSYKLGAAKAEKLDGPPSVLRNRLYINNPAASQSLWIDERDGKGVLLAYDTATKEDKVVKSQTGLKTPVRWLNDKYVIYRINSGQETADYVINLDGGEAKKLKDATDTSGIESWYYY